MKLFLRIYFFCIATVIALPINKTAINIIHPVVPDIGETLIFIVILIKTNAALYKLQTENVL